VTENDGFADTPGREATPEEEARVAALLASLRDDDVPMPDDVWSRLSAVIAEEHVAATARQLAGEPVALGDDADSTGHVAAVSVLPSPEQRRRRGAPGWLLGAAAAAVVVLLAGGLVKGLGTGGSSAGGTAMSVAEPSVATSARASASGSASAESSSNTAYTRVALPVQAAALVASQAWFAARSPQVAEANGSGTDAGAVTTSSTPATPMPGATSTRSVLTPVPTGSTKGQPGTGSLAAPPLLAGATLAACLVQLTGSTTVAAVAVDRGTYEGKPADVVVVPTANDETQLDVWVLAPGCTATNADVFTFARIARP
jgi:hypothetical protein